MNKRTLPLATPYLLFLLMLWSSASMAQSGDYYMYRGQRIPLETSSAYTAFALPPGQKSPSIAADVRSIGELAPSSLLESRGIALVRLQSGTSKSAIQRQARNAQSKGIVIDQPPVYSAYGIDQVLTNDFIARFNPSTDMAEDERLAVLEQSGAIVDHRDHRDSLRYHIHYPGISPRDGLAIVNQLSADPRVDFAQPNFVRLHPKRPNLANIRTSNRSKHGSSNKSKHDSKGINLPNDPLIADQWYLHNTGERGVADADIDAPEAWEIQKGSKNIIVAVLDEGVDTRHPDLRSKIVTPYDATDRDNDQAPKAWDAHGTACAGIIAAVTGNGKGVAGIAPEARIMPVRIAYSDGEDSPFWTTSSEWIADGIITAVDRGARVLSNSWGGGPPDAVIRSAIEYGLSRRCVLVFAAGNEAGRVSYPARYASELDIIAVSATNRWDEFKTPVSSDGEEWGSNYGPEVTVSAPGVEIITTDIRDEDGYNYGDYGNDYTTFNGTSSATPIVSGVAALLLSQRSFMHPREVKEILSRTADDLGSPGYDERFGHGRINAQRALKFIRGIK